MHPINLFVYGTLRKGEYFHAVLKQSECIWDSCWTKGIMVINDVQCPELIPTGQGRVVGELYRVTEEVLLQVDKIEGYTAEGADNLYERVLLDVYSEEGHTVKAYSYIAPHSDLTDKKRIASGDWKRQESPPPFSIRLQEAWDRTLSWQERDTLFELNRSTPHPSYDALSFVGIRAGFNYQGELFATVLIKNGFPSDVSGEGLALTFYANGTPITTHTFWLPNLVIPAQTSMPWTFLFPMGKDATEEIELSSWRLELVEMIR